MDTAIFNGCLPAIMTPCKEDRTPDFEALVKKALELVDAGMSGVIYCGSMGDWPLLTDEQRMEGVARLCEAGVPVVVGTGAQNPQLAAAHAAHAESVGAKGLMVIPRVLSRGTSTIAQRHHFHMKSSKPMISPKSQYNHCTAPSATLAGQTLRPASFPGNMR